MPREPLPQNYILQADTLFEDFENAASFSKSGTDPLGTVAADTTNVKFGSEALRLTVNTAGSNITAVKTIDQLFSDSTVFHFWIYVPDDTPNTNVTSLEITFSSYTNYAQYFKKTLGTGYKCFVRGWNHIAVHASEFVNYTTESWTRPMVRMTFRVFYLAGQTGYITLDNLSVGQESLVKCIFSFDDCDPTVYSNVFAKMSSLGLKGTVYLTKNIITEGSGLTIAQINEMYAAGWAICNHTVSHPYLNLLTPAEIEAEIQGCTDWLVSNGWTRAAKHLAWPWGTVMTSDMLIACQSTGIFTARTPWGGEPEMLPCQDLYQLRGHQLMENTTLANMKTWVDQCARKKGTLNIYGHAIADGHEGDTFYWGATKFNGLIDYLVARKIPCVTIDEWYRGLTDPRYSSVSLSRS